MQFVMTCLITTTCIMKVRIYIHNELYKLLTCIVTVSIPYDNVAAASFMYSTYVHCLHYVTMLLRGAWLL